MRFHKEGRTILWGTTILVVAIVALLAYLLPNIWYWFSIIIIAFWLLIVQFFRNPKRVVAHVDNGIVYAPADGKVVVIEEAEEVEYFKEKRLQISIFMSPLNVHVTRAGIGGKVVYKKHHKGLYLVAWHPKSSTENERCTVVVDTGEHKILIKQIAGAVARRIVNYVNVGDEITQGNDIGFIKFGSRVDLVLPLDAKVEVSINDVVKGNQTVIARI